MTLLVLFVALAFLSALAIFGEYQLEKRDEAKRQEAKFRHPARTTKEAD